MKRVSLTTLSAGLSLVLLAAPMAMAQQYPAHHSTSAPHGTEGHQMQAPIHRTVSTHNRMGTRAPEAHVQPHKVSMQHHTMQPPHRAAMPSHGSVQHHS
jgi:hypothetical protein